MLEIIVEIGLNYWEPYSSYYDETANKHGILKNSRVVVVVKQKKMPT